MNIKVYPTRFEAYQDIDKIFKIESFDGYTSTIYILSPVNSELWREISPLIEKCLIEIELGKVG